MLPRDEIVRKELNRNNSFIVSVLSIKNFNSLGWTKSNVVGFASVFSSVLFHIYSKIFHAYKPENR